LKQKILAILTAAAVVLSAVFSAAFWLLTAGLRAAGSFLGGGGPLNPALFLVCASAILPALLAIASAVFLRKRAKARAVVVGIAFGLAVLEASFGVLGAVGIYGYRPVQEETVLPQGG
jgi:hypothetical protein